MVVVAHRGAAVILNIIQPNKLYNITITSVCLNERRMQDEKVHQNENKNSERADRSRVKTACLSLCSMLSLIPAGVRLFQEFMELLRA
jgi:hypothetical protein